MGGGDFVMGTGPWWLKLHLVRSPSFNRSMCAPAACATGVCQTGRTFFKIIQHFEQKKNVDTKGTLWVGGVACTLETSA